MLTIFDNLIAENCSTIDFRYFNLNFYFCSGVSTPKKSCNDSAAGTSSATPLRPILHSPTAKPIGSFGRYLKVDIRSKAQLKFDMDVLKYLVKSNLPFNHVKSEGFIDFLQCTADTRKYHIKNPSTYSRAKLPLLYRQVKQLVIEKIAKDLPGTTGFSFTADMWSSR